MLTKIFYFLTLAAILLLPIPASAETNKLPEMLVGGTELLVNGRTIYGGPVGNYAVLNHDIDGNYGFKTQIVNQCSPTLTPIPFCFVLGTGILGDNSPGDGKLLVSRTSVSFGGETKDLYETPALFMGSINVIGDAYGSNLSNFAFWGRNLAQIPTDDPNKAADSSASWGMRNYPLNSAAQSSLTSAETANFKEKNKNLMLEGTRILDSELNPTSDSQLYLQAGGKLILTIDQTDENKFAEGKVWVVDNTTTPGTPDDLTLTGDITKTFHGQGTIIVDDLDVGNGVDIKPETADDHLGIIAYGNVTFRGNNKITAPIISLGKMNFLGNNITLNGSYVAAGGFDQISSRSNISIFYDYNLSSDWPPGFRYLAMPHPKEVGNQ